jgi:hypothetical protein
MPVQKAQVDWLSTSSVLIVLVAIGMLVLLPAVSSQPALSLSISTDKPQYLSGETVTISGVVRDNQSNPMFGASVSIQVDDPGGNVALIQLVSSDQSGSYSYQWSLPANSAQGQYVIYASASKPGYGNGQNQASFAVTASTTLASTSTTPSSTSSSTTTSSTTTPLTTTSTTSPLTTSLTQTTSSSTYDTTTLSLSSTVTNSPPQCLIATATYGSALAPEVTLLRDFRDSEILQTSAGRSFMLVFNAFYYSFSPGVASYITAHSSIRDGMKVLLYPLVGILYGSSLLFSAVSFNGEVAVISAGITASLGIGAIYLGPFLTILERIFKSHSSTLYSRAFSVSLISGIASLGGLLLAELAHFAALLEVTSTCVVLSNIALGTFFFSWTLARIWPHLRK